MQSWLSPSVQPWLSPALLVLRAQPSQPCLVLVTQVMKQDQTADSSHDMEDTLDQYPNGHDSMVRSSYCSTNSPLGMPASISRLPASAAMAAGCNFGCPVLANRTRQTAGLMFLELNPPSYFHLDTFWPFGLCLMPFIRHSLPMNGASSIKAAFCQMQRRRFCAKTHCGRGLCAAMHACVHVQSLSGTVAAWQVPDTARRAHIRVGTADQIKRQAAKARWSFYQVRLPSA